MKKTWYYGIIFYDKTFPFTTRLSQNKEEISSYCDELWKGYYELRSIEIDAE